MQLQFITTHQELQEVINTAVMKAVAIITRSQGNDKPIDRCNFNDALKITGLSKSKMYKLTSTGNIPCKQYGNRLVFSRNELLAWMETETKPKHDLSALHQVLAESAKKKGAAK